MKKIGWPAEIIGPTNFLHSSLESCFILGWFWSFQDFEPVRRGGDGERSQHLPQRAGPALLPGVLLGGPDQEGQGQDQEEEERQEVTDKCYADIYIMGYI